MPADKIGAAYLAALATVMLVFTTEVAVAQEKETVSPAGENTKAEMKEGGAIADLLLENERASISDIQIKRGDRTKFSGLVPIGKHRKMYLECIGAGSPTVVYIAGGFEAGWISKYALDSTDLVLEEPVDALSDGRGDVRMLDRAVFPTAGRLTRVCNYDRPNTTLRDDIHLERGGRASTPVTQPHALEPDVADLRALLTAAKVPGPYVLVAHSYGGLIAELYARTYPKEVTGGVHIDVTNDDSKKAVYPTTARETRVCAYDRPNTRTDGKDTSTPRAQPHAVDDDVAELYARTYPEEVGGLVMVDAGSSYIGRAVSRMQRSHGDKDLYPRRDQEDVRG